MAESARLRARPARAARAGDADGGEAQVAPGGRSVRLHRLGNLDERSRFVVGRVGSITSTNVKLRQLSWLNTRGETGDRHRRVERDRRCDEAALREGGRDGVYTGSRREGNLDVDRRASSRRAFVDAALAELGGLDILVNNAGLSRGRDPVWDSLDDDEHEVIETNVLGLMRMTRLCVPP